MYSSGALISSGFVFAKVTNSSTQGGQQNSYVLPPTIQENLGLAFVNEMGQSLSPTLGLVSCSGFSPLNLTEATTFPLASMSAEV